jgi:hypothetical protein
MDEETRASSLSSNSHNSFLSFAAHYKRNRVVARFGALYSRSLEQC